MLADTIWVDLLVGLAPLAGALCVLVGVMATVRQRDKIDRREQWWKRVEWAAGLVTSADETSRLIGMSALLSLVAEIDVVHRGDADFIRAIVASVDLSRFVRDADTSGGREGMAS